MRKLRQRLDSVLECDKSMHTFSSTTFFDGHRFLRSSIHLATASGVSSAMPVPSMTALLNEGVSYVVQLEQRSMPSNCWAHAESKRKLTRRQASDSHSTALAPAPARRSDADPPHAPEPASSVP